MGLLHGAPLSSYRLNRSLKDAEIGKHLGLGFVHGQLVVTGDNFEVRESHSAAQRSQRANRRSWSRWKY